MRLRRIPADVVLEPVALGSTKAGLPMSYFPPLRNWRLPDLRKPCLPNAGCELSLTSPDPRQIMFLGHFDTAMTEQRRYLVDGTPASSSSTAKVSRNM